MIIGTPFINITDPHKRQQYSDQNNTESWDEQHRQHDQLGEHLWKSCDKNNLDMLDKIFPRTCLSLLVFVPEVIKVLIINLKKEFNQVGFLGFNLSPSHYPVFSRVLALTNKQDWKSSGCETKIRNFSWCSYFSLTWSTSPCLNLSTARTEMSFKDNSSGTPTLLKIKNQCLYRWVDSGISKSSSPVFLMMDNYQIIDQ